MYHYTYQAKYRSPIMRQAIVQVLVSNDLNFLRRESIVTESKRRFTFSVPYSPLGYKVRSQLKRLGTILNQQPPSITLLSRIEIKP